ncbi:pilus assembly protein N-terminal domain-containing protein, partial [Mycobacterium tuberculosis]|nr:pilus assembly protein N-terminal domain-containing protein [Mycobacterium tuberculosis]
MQAEVMTMAGWNSRLLCGVAVIGLLSAPALAKDPIVVTMDRAKVMRIPAPADTVIIGNPAIADVSIHDRQTLV